MYDEVKALVGVISENENDYTDSSAYRMVMDKLSPVKDKLAVMEKNRSELEAYNELMEKRYKKADETWMDYDLGYDAEDDVHIETNGWAVDGNHYTRTYFISVNGDESTAHCFSIEFEEGNDTVI